MTLYVPAQFAVEERAAIARLVDEHPFATLITPAAPEPQVSHLPLLLVADAGPQGTLIGHMARANPHWRHAAGVDSIAIFHGPHAYVSPSWYAKPEEAVPTWNYAVVHVHGRLEVIDDAAPTRDVLDALVLRFEGNRAAPWRFAMPERQRDALIGAIVAFRLRIDRVSAKFKLSQNRPAEDQVRVVAALEREGYTDALAVAGWMRAYGAGASNG